MVVALRVWQRYWQDTRSRLAVRSDNLATLALVAKMQPHSRKLGLLARELALDIAESSFAPEVVAHIPGIANGAADALSRIEDPLKRAAVPAFLRDIPSTTCPPRDGRWYKSLPASSAGYSGMG